MTIARDQKDNKPGEKEPASQPETAPADPAHAGSKPGKRHLSDEEAFAELRRRQIERQR